MDKESIYQLQLIDCNCNDCKHMVRDLSRLNQRKEVQRVEQQAIFDAEKAKAISDAKAVQDDKTREGMLRVANKMQFQFKSPEFDISYGHCQKFNKQVCFISGTCQIETQGCFEHRKLTTNP